MYQDNQTGSPRGANHAHQIWIQRGSDCPQMGQTGNFSDQIQYILAHNVLNNLIYGAKSGIRDSAWLCSFS